ncbi:MAG TPA: amidohydrolase family protein, partial [Negativicutes bacterium]|nr:amidohydrolase family protein [Negativicutes bacterium]
HGLSLPEAVNMATLNPAKAIFKDKELGSIEPGKAADLVLVEEVVGIPFVDQVFVKGLCVLSAERSLCGRINGADYGRREREC